MPSNRSGRREGEDTQSSAKAEKPGAQSDTRWDKDEESSSSRAQAVASSKEKETPDAVLPGENTLPNDSMCERTESDIYPPASIPSLEYIQSLVGLLEESGIGEISVWGGGAGVRLSADMPSFVTPASLKEGGDSIGRVASNSERVGGGREGTEEVPSPLVGTFYTAPSPEDAPFASPGDTVATGQPLCIVEAMKLMNEVPAPIDGEVTEVLVENGQGVEYGQALFLIRPGSG